MATIDQAMFELARRGYQWSANSTLDDGITSMLWDSNPNNAVTGNTPGETKIVAMPVGSMFIQSSGILWLKSGTPNVWVNLSTGGTGLPSYSTSFVVGDWIGPSAGLYTIPFTHNLNVPLIEVEVWDNLNRPIDVERILTSNNIVTLRIPADPDLRFAGLIWVKQT